MQHLSDEWFDAVTEGLAGVAVPPDVAVALRHEVDGDGSHTIALGGGRAVLHRADGGPAPDVTLHCDRITARDLATGSLSVPEAVLSGRLTVSGDVTTLEAAAEALDAVAVVVRAVTPRTSPA